MSARDHILQALIDDAWLGHEGEGESAGLSSDDLYGIADAILASDWLAEHDRKVKAEALQDAANTTSVDFHMDVALGGAQYVRQWLRDRADRIETDHA